MSKYSIAICSAVALAAAAAASAQATSPAFTASGTRCEDVTWSQETLAKYPKIGAACQSVMQRDGKYFVVLRVPAMTDSCSGDGGHHRSEATQAGGLLYRLSVMVPRGIGLAHRLG